MRPSIPRAFDDPDFSFQDQAKNHESSRRKLIPPPGRTRGPSWKISGNVDGPEPPRWEITVLDQKTGQRFFNEIGPPPPAGTGFAAPEHQRSRFKLTITEQCFVAAQLAEVGDQVECWNRAAAELLGSGRARIIEEVRP